jgi:tetratricopeptide (TPR) repeat protein
MPLDILKKGEAHLPGVLAGAVKNQIVLTDAVKALRRYSLVRVDDDALSIHRLVQAVVLDRLNGQDKKDFAEASVNIANDAFSFRGDDRQSIQECLRLLPHAMTAAGHGEDCGVAREVVGKLLNKVAVYLAGSKHFIESKAMFQRALKILEQAHGPGSPNLANALNNLGSVQRMLDELEEAKISHERALSIDESIYGMDHQEIALDLYNLALVLIDLNSRGEALRHFKRALAICVNKLGEDHPDTQFMRENLERLNL